MVLWEMTLMTAYFLGLKRTYKLALRIQRRLIGPNHPRIREFLHKRTRNVFDVAVAVHKNIQERDIEVGRNLGNMILRWLDRIKPSAQIRPPKAPISGNEIPKHVISSGMSLGAKKANAKPIEQGTKGRVLFTALNARHKYYPTVSMMMMQPRRFTSVNSQYRHTSFSTLYASASAKRRGILEGVFRDDIAQLILNSS